MSITQAFYKSLEKELEKETWYEKLWWEIQMFFWRPYDKIKTACHHVKWGFQRMFRGWDDRAAWSVDYWLFQHLPRILEQLAKYKHGYPGEYAVMFYNDLTGEGLTVPTESSEARDKFCAECWTKYITLLAKKFDYANPDRNDIDEICPNPYDANSYKTDDEEFDRWCKKEHERDEIRSKELHEALKSLEKTIESLWD